jgi:Spy/CpxP family protein refolding chaperone
MKTSNSRRRAVAVVAMVLTLAAVARPCLAGPHRGGARPFGMGGPGGHGGDPGMLFAMALRGVDLTAEQKTKVQQILAAHREHFADVFRQLRAANEAFAGRLLQPGALALDDLKPQIAAVAKLREALMEEGAQVALELRAVLTPEQLAQAASVASRLKALHEEMRKLLHEPDGGPGAP